MQTGVATQPAASAPLAPAIAAQGVHQRYGSQEVLRGFGLELEPGTVFGLIGPSGSGKTTAIRLLTGIHRPVAGDISVLGKPPSAFTPADREAIGYLPQLPVLFPALSLWENLSFVGSIYGMPLRRRRRMREVLEFVELWDDRRKRLRDASGGMQRRLALAASIIHEPTVLFLDEPTAGIDPMLRRKFWEHFAALRDEGRTIFVTTQYVGEAAYCDLVGVLDQGRLVAVDTPDGLRRRAFGGDVLQVRLAHDPDHTTVESLRGQPFVSRCERLDAEGGLQVTVDEAASAIPQISSWLADQGLEVETVHQDQPPFDDVFVKLVEDGAR